MSPKSGTDCLKVLKISIAPITGFVVIVFLTEEISLLQSILLLPFSLALPLIAWSTVKMIGQIRNGQIIDWKYLALYGLGLVILAFAVCFLFLAEAIGSHGTDHGMFGLKCLFALTTIVTYPFVDLYFFRASQQLDIGTGQKLRFGALLSKTILIAVALFLLVRIVGPPLNMALRLQYQGIAKALIDAGADVKQSDRHGATPLWYAVHRVDKVMTLALLSKGATLDDRLAGFGLTRAIEADNPDMLRLLLSRGANPNAPYMGATPLVIACQRGNKSMIRLLLDNGADMNMKSRYPNMPYDGKSALDIARERGDAQVIKLLLPGVGQKRGHP